MHSVQIFNFFIAQCELVLEFGSLSMIFGWICGVVFLESSRKNTQTILQNLELTPPYAAQSTPTGNPPRTSQRCTADAYGALAGPDLAVTQGAAGLGTVINLEDWLSGDPRGRWAGNLGES